MVGQRRRQAQARQQTQTLNDVPLYCCASSSLNPYNSSGYINDIQNDLAFFKGTSNRIRRNRRKCCCCSQNEIQLQPVSATPNAKDQQSTSSQQTTATTTTTTVAALSTTTPTTLILVISLIATLIQQQQWNVSAVFVHSFSIQRQQGRRYHQAIRSTATKKVRLDVQSVTTTTDEESLKNNESYVGEEHLDGIVDLTNMIRTETNNLDNFRSCYEDISLNSAVPFHPLAGLLQRAVTSLIDSPATCFPNEWRNQPTKSTTSRRNFFGSSIVVASTAIIGSSNNDPAYAVSFFNKENSKNSEQSVSKQQQQSRLQWQVTPVNKRTGVTVFDAERAGYKVNFVTYLSRFLLTFDTDCQRWWYNRASDIPRTATSQQVTQYRNAQFAAFSASVEVGLQEYRGPNGPEQLLLSLIRRYGPDAIPRDGFSTDPSTRARQDRESREARRQICLLFGLMEQNQPVAALTKQLAAIDNGSISRVVIEDRGSGYAPGYGSPQVRFPVPEAGEGYETATGRAVLTPNGRLLRIDVVNRGNGYSKPPTVLISPPAAVRFADTTIADTAESAEAVAYLFRSGPNKGRIQRIELTSPGKGYTSKEIIRIRINPPEMTPQEGGITATSTAVLEYEVSDILIVNNGTGYAVEKPIRVFVEPPPLTARVNMNDPMMAGIISPNQALPATTIPSPELRKKMPDLQDPKSVAYQANTEASKGGGGGCIGRACYDRPVRAIAFAASESKNVFDSFRQADDDPLRSMNKGLDGVNLGAATLPPQRIVSASDSTGDIPEPINFISGGAGASSELLTLLPAGVGLEFNALYNRYELAVDPNYDDKAPLWMRGYNSARKIDPDFGPRGRAPIERDMQLGFSSYLRFLLSGAICCSGVHLILTPIDVVKTKVQTDPQKYPGIIQGFQKVLKEDGIEGFSQGWVPTFVGYFTWGGVSYALTELIRRSLTEALGVNAANYEVPIILGASALGAFVGSFILCPFESVRIRSVSQKDFAPDIVQVVLKMIDEEGLLSLFQAIPGFLAKEIPFAMAKFTVFDLSTSWLYYQFPAAKEDLQLSLLVTLLGGTVGGLCAAVVSNPADVTISTMKRAKSDLGALTVAQMIVQKDGVAALFRGLPLRMIFVALNVSFQFLIYDSVRFALGIGSDDLKLYLDVLGGALSGSGGAA